MLRQKGIPRMQAHSYESRVSNPDEPLHLALHELGERIGRRVELIGR